MQQSVPSEEEKSRQKTVHIQAYSAWNCIVYDEVSNYSINLKQKMFYHHSQNIQYICIYYSASIYNPVF